MAGLSTIGACPGKKCLKNALELRWIPCPVPNIALNATRKPDRPKRKVLSIDTLGDLGESSTIQFRADKINFDPPTRVVAGFN